MKSDTRKKIYEMAVRTFELTCCMFPLEKWELEEAVAGEPDSDVRSLVAFRGAGDGAVVLHPDRELIAAIASNMLGVEEPDREVQAGALNEIANIICGNMAPLFSADHAICKITPPVTLAAEETPGRKYEAMEHETIRLCLDEGVADLIIHYTAEGLQ